jgi:hypothetical protein
MKREQKQGIANAALTEYEWNFNGIPDNELVAGCYWEYARESAFIREVVQNLKDVDERKGSHKPLDEANRDLTRFYSVGTPAQLVVNPKFPEPWLLLTKSDRQKLAKNFKPEISVPGKILPFRVTGDLFVAAMIHGEAKHVQTEQLAAYQRLSEIDQGVANLDEANKLRNKMAAPVLPPVLHGVGGVDSFIAQVNWQDFTDKEIVAAFRRWIADNRPTAADTKQLVGRRNDKGHKLNDWRVMLDRLAIMRLLHHATLNEMPIRFLLAWKQYSSADWYRERKNANHNFHRLFPFLENEMPSSWRTKGGHG